MARAFVTYSHEDTDFVERLVSDLESAGLDLVFDKQLMLLGDSLLKIFEEIGTVEFLLAILSPHSVKSNWVRKELSVAVVREIEEQGFRVIPVFKEQCELPLDLMQALRDKNQARFHEKEYNEVLRELVEALSGPTNARTLYGEFQGKGSDNPFRRVRAEHFESISTLARSYSEPEAARYERIVETKPVFLEGGRGSGKTMTLKSMLPQALVSRQNHRRLEETKLSYFGVYLRCVPGSFTTQTEGIEEIIGANRSSTLFLSETILKLTQALVEELKACSDVGILQVPSSRERQFLSNVANVVRPLGPNQSLPSDLDELQRFLDKEIRFNRRLR